MRPPAVSLDIRTTSPSEAARRAAGLVSRLDHPSGGLLFAAGDLGDRLSLVAEALSTLETGIPWLLASTTGLATERGEIEGESAAAALVFSQGRGRVQTIDVDDSSLVPEAIGQAVANSPAVPRLLLVRSLGLSPDRLADLGRLTENHCLFGAGTPTRHLPHTIQPDGSVSSGVAALFEFDGPRRPSFLASPAARLLTQPATITASDGPRVLSIEGRPALDALNQIGQRVTRPDLILVALLDAEETGPKAVRPPFVLRMLHGVDPARGALVLGEQPPPGARLAIAVRDAEAARNDLDHRLRELRAELAGAAPRFGLYLDCLGRGRGLYGHADVDLRLIRQHLGEFPLLGLKSAFEIGPSATRTAIFAFTGLLSLFTAPS